MDTDGVARAVAAATSVAVALELHTDDVFVIQNSNRLALRLLPCEVFAHAAPMGEAVGAALEIELAQRFAATGVSVAALEPRVEPRVYQRDGFAIPSHPRPSPQRSTLAHARRA